MSVHTISYDYYGLLLLLLLLIIAIEYSLEMACLFQFTEFYFWPRNEIHRQWTVQCSMSLDCEFYALMRRMLILEFIIDIIRKFS